MEFNLVIQKFELNHHLCGGFKKKLKSSFSRTLSNATDWEKLIEPNPDVAERLEEPEDQITGLRESLHEVQRIHQKI